MPRLPCAGVSSSGPAADIADRNLDAGRRRGPRLMDPSVVASLVWGVGTVAVASAVAVVVGRRRGLDQVDARADSETAKLVAAQASRMGILEAENRRLSEAVASLAAQVSALKVELEIERRITARIRADAAK